MGFSSPPSSPRPRAPPSVRLQSWQAYGGEAVADITVARNLKEAGCRVHPTPLARLTHSPGGAPPSGFNIAELFELPPPAAEPVLLGHHPFNLGWERYPPPEAARRDCGGWEYSQGVRTPWVASRQG